MKIHESWQQPSACKVNNRGVRWISEVADLTHPQDARAIDDHDGRLARSCAGSVDQRCSFKDEQILALHELGSPSTAGSDKKEDGL